VGHVLLQFRPAVAQVNYRHASPGHRLGHQDAAHRQLAAQHLQRQQTLTRHKGLVHPQHQPRLHEVHVQAHDAAQINGLAARVYLRDQALYILIGQRQTAGVSGIVPPPGPQPRARVSHREPDQDRAAAFPGPQPPPAPASIASECTRPATRA